MPTKAYSPYGSMEGAGAASGAMIVARRWRENPSRGQGRGTHPGAEVPQNALLLVAQVCPGEQRLRLTVNEGIILSQNRCQTRFHPLECEHSS